MKIGPRSVKWVLVVAAVCVPGGATSAQGVLHTSLGLDEGEFLGTSVARAGDENGDGYADVVIGAPFAKSGALYVGRVLVLAGQSGELIRQHLGAAAGDQFGRSVAGAGDVDGDGVDDILVGAPGSDAGAVNAGRAYVYSGLTGAQLHVFTGAAAHDAFGSSVAGAGDVDGDGRADLVVGAPLADPHGLSSGTVRVLSGASGGTLLLVQGNVAYAEFGRAVAGAGDVNADGRPDLLAGAPYDASTGIVTGSVRVISGLDGGALMVLRGDAEDDEFGFSVAGPGDVDADGAGDLLVGARRHDAGGTDAGSAFLYSGAEGALLLTLHGEQPNDLFGASVARAGDVDADGVPDLLVGAPHDHCNGFNCGAVYAYSAEGGEPLLLIHGDPGDQLGTAVAGGGDADGDGRDDLVAGAPAGDEYATDGGIARGYGATPWVNIGLTLGGEQGDSSFSGSGSLQGNEPVSFMLSDAAPLAPSMLVLGLTVVNVPFKGGTLVPQPDFVSAALSTDATGSLVVGGTWPAGIPPLTTVALQWWTLDDSLPSGFGSSNGLVALTP
jgi:hypothetical protein